MSLGNSPCSDICVLSYENELTETDHQQTFKLVAGTKQHIAVDLKDCSCRKLQYMFDGRKRTFKFKDLTANQK